MENFQNNHRKLNNQINKFSGKYMNNSKWTKLFYKLSEHHDLVKRCLLKDIWNEIEREIKIPTIENFSTIFQEKGIKDGRCGPHEFKEIEQVIFPRTWTKDRNMRAQILEPHFFDQNIEKINSIIKEIGKFETEFNNESLIIYAYRQ